MILIFLVEKRQQGRFAGFSLYVSNTGLIDDSTLCYKDGPKLPPLNFSTICAKSGRYVIFYNERRDGVIYPEDYEVVNVFTELCEVIVQGIDWYFLILYYIDYHFVFQTTLHLHPQANLLKNDWKLKFLSANRLNYG